MSLGSQIREARKSKDKTQVEVAEALGVSVQAVSQWETDKTVPTAKNLIDLSKHLDMNLNTQISVRDMLSHLPPPWDSKVAVAAPLVHWGNPDFWGKATSDEEGFDPDSYDEEYFDVRWKPVGDVFALRIRNLDMTPTFMRGDIVIIDTGRAPEKGDFVVAKIDNWAEATLAIYEPKGRDESRLPVFHLHFTQKDPVVVSARDPGYVVGTVREHRRYFRTS